MQSSHGSVMGLGFYGDSSQHFETTPLNKCEQKSKGVFLQLVAEQNARCICTSIHCEESCDENRQKKSREVSRIHKREDEFKFQTTL